MSEAFYSVRPFEQFVQGELDLRKKNISIESPTDNSYQGPYNSWCRFTSLADVKFSNSNKVTEGLILHTDNFFENVYGLEKDKPSSQIGYDKNGEPVYLPENYGVNINRPSPGITGLENELQGSNEVGKFRTTIVKWKCFDKYQLQYLTAFFMTLGVGVIVEWGWNNNPESLIDVSNPATLTKIRNDSTFFMKKREASKGRYDGQMGIVKSFDYTMTADGGFECSTEISFQSELLLEMSTKAEKSEDKQGESNKKFVSYLKENLKAWVEGKPIQPNWFPKWVTDLQYLVFL